MHIKDIFQPQPLYMKKIRISIYEKAIEANYAMFQKNQLLQEIPCFL